MCALWFGLTVGGLLLTFGLFMLATVNPDLVPVALVAAAFCGGSLGGLVRMAQATRQAGGRGRRSKYLMSQTIYLTPLDT